MSPVVLTDPIKREAGAVPCECGGYADRVPCSSEEIKTQGCSRDYECCSRAFVCRICKVRMVGTAEAPDIAW